MQGMEMIRSVRSATARWVQGSRHASLIGIVLLSAGPLVPAQEPLPYLHLTKDAGDDVQRYAHFGYSAAKGRLGATTDTRDDVVACAIDADEPKVNPTFANCGVA